VEDRSQPDRRSAGDRAAAIAASRTRVEALEAALGAASLEFRARSAPITVAKVQAALPRGALLAEFVRYQRFAAARAQQRSQPDRDVAYLLTRQGPPRWVELGDAAPIDTAVDAALDLSRSALRLPPRRLRGARACFAARTTERRRAHAARRRTRVADYRYFDMWIGRPAA
jgi:hypothetical protein